MRFCLSKINVCYFFKQCMERLTFYTNVSVFIEMSSYNRTSQELFLESRKKKARKDSRVLILEFATITKNRSLWEVGALTSYSTWGTAGIEGNISDFKWERKCSKYLENKILCISGRKETTSWAPKPLRPKSHLAPWGKRKHGIICLLSMGISFQSKCYGRMSLLWQSSIWRKAE